ncbi:hypothetical protein [Rhizobium sp. KDH_Rht_773_N]
MQPLHQQLLKILFTDGVSPMSDVFPPDIPRNDPDRFMRCQEAMHIGFAAFVDRAILAGWQADEVLAAIIDLADNHALMLAANGEVDDVLAMLNRRP